MKTVAYALILTLVAGGSYWWYTKEVMPCQIPIAYSIGTIDPRFGLSEADVKAAVADAEALWEREVAQELFVYDENADFKINFKYDDRQATTNAAQNLSDVLEDRKGMSEEVSAAYQEKLTVYESEKATYEAQVEAYERRVNAYEADVEKWNTAGGAPQGEYERLNKEQQALEAEERSLNREAARLNALVAELNALGEEGNELVENYNNTVEIYNTRFGHDHEEEFTQGDFQGDSINIYEYRDEEELILVLAHEFGHAIGIGHVEGGTSLMHYLMEDQTLAEGVSEEDIAALSYTCSISPWEYFMNQLGFQEASVIASFQKFE